MPNLPGTATVERALQEMYDYRSPEERWTLLDQAKDRYWGAREEGLRECLSLLQEAFDYHGRWSVKGREALEAMEWANGELETLIEVKNERMLRENR